jgi:broad specificity phosphatase PhoE
MPVIYFIRHGQTDWNAENRLQGQRDIPLNDTGRGQARRNGRVLAGLIADAQALDYVASPLSRATETMKIVRGELGLAHNGFRTEPMLKEIAFGRWEGLTVAETRSRDPEAAVRRAADPWDWVAPGEGGESFAMVQARVCRWLDTVSRDTVVVAHGGIKRCLRGHIEKLEPAAILKLDVPQDKVMVIRDGTVTLV